MAEQDAIVPASTDVELASPNGGGSASLSLATARSVALMTAQRAQMNVVSKTGQENAVIMAVRRQLEALEEKFNGQFTRVQQQGEKLRETALARYDSKVSNLETNLPRVERRVAEISGNLRGLSDEVQCQIRRIDQADSRLWDWRHHLEEEIRAKFNEIDQHFQQVTSSMRVQKTMADDQFKKFTQRLHKLEGLVDERVTASEDTHQSIMQLHMRLTDVEDRDSERVREMAIALPTSGTATLAADMQGGTDHVAVVAMEAQCTEFARKIDHMQDEFHSILERLESQEERYKSMRTLSETKDEQYRVIADRLERENWDGRFKEVQSRLQQLDETRIAHTEELEILAKKLENEEQAHDELGNVMRRMQERGAGVMAEFGMTPDAFEDAAGHGDAGAEGAMVKAGASFGSAGALAMQVATRLRDSEGRMMALASELEAVRADKDLGTHVATLVDTLRDLAPKVINHDTMLKQMQTELTAGVSECTTQGKNIGSTVDAIKDTFGKRLDRLESDVQQLASEAK
mmetsp:Transcript_106839/g.299128  ORF Transcript_106839/g.299128 Transcript_106839/m.299128 type:complete len:518 (+) Transcript_106839:92-1645(+)